MYFVLNSTSIFVINFNLTHFQVCYKTYFQFCTLKRVWRWLYKCSIKKKNFCIMWNFKTCHLFNFYFHCLKIKSQENVSLMALKYIDWLLHISFVSFHFNKLNHLTLQIKILLKQKHMRNHANHGLRRTQSEYILSDPTQIEKSVRQTEELVDPEFRRRK